MNQLANAWSKANGRKTHTYAVATATKTPGTANAIAIRLTTTLTNWKKRTTGYAVSQPKYSRLR